MSRPPLGSIAFGSIPWYSVLIVTAVALGIWLASREERRLGLPKDSVLDFVLWAVPLAIVGARLYYVAFRWDMYANDLGRILNTREGGLAIYGGILGGLLAAVIVTRHKRLSFAMLLDACAPSLLLGQAIGRWGNYANMEAFGPAVTNPAFQFFPLAVEIPSAEGWTWHMATFFYESFWCAIGFAVLWSFRKRTKRPGDVMLWYALWYGAGRAVIEGLRTDSLMFLNGSIRVSQLLSAAVLLVIMLIFTKRLTRMRMLDILGWGIALTALCCATLSEVERSAMPAWYRYDQMLCILLAALDVAFLGVYIFRARRFDTTAGIALAAIVATVAVVLFGLSWRTRISIAYVSILQALCFAHTLLFCAWLYARLDAPHHASLQKEA